MIELEDFVKLIKLLEENYNKTLPDSILKIWYDEFKTYEPTKLKEMIISSIKEYIYFPTINQVKNILSNPKIPNGYKVGDTKEENGFKYILDEKEGWVINGISE